MQLNSLLGFLGMSTPPQDGDAVAETPDASKSSAFSSVLSATLSVLGHKNSGPQAPPQEPPSTAAREEDEELSEAQVTMTGQLVGLHSLSDPNTEASTEEIAADEDNETESPSQEGNLKITLAPGHDVAEAADAAPLTQDAALRAQDAALVPKDAASPTQDATLSSQDAALPAQEAALPAQNGGATAKDGAQHSVAASKNPEADAARASLKTTAGMSRKPSASEPLDVKKPASQATPIEPEVEARHTESIDGTPADLEHRAEANVSAANRGRHAGGLTARTIVQDSEAQVKDSLPLSGRENGRPNAVHQDVHEDKLAPQSPRHEELRSANRGVRIDAEPAGAEDADTKVDGTASRAGKPASSPTDSALPLRSRLSGDARETVARETVSENVRRSVIVEEVFDHSTGKPAASSADDSENLASAASAPSDVASLAESDGKPKEAFLTRTSVRAAALVRSVFHHADKKVVSGEPEAPAKGLVNAASEENSTVRKVPAFRGAPAASKEPLANPSQQPPAVEEVPISGDRPSASSAEPDVRIDSKAVVDAGLAPRHAEAKVERMHRHEGKHGIQGTTQSEHNQNSGGADTEGFAGDPSQSGSFEQSTETSFESNSEAFEIPAESVADSDAASARMAVEEISFTPEHSNTITSTVAADATQAGSRSRAAGTMAWLRSMLGETLGSMVLDNGWKVIEMSLDEGQGTMTVKARREEDRVSVSLSFTDPQLRALAEANSGRLHDLLQERYESNVDFSLMSDGAGNSPRRRDEARSNGQMTTNSGAVDTVALVEKSRISRVALAGARNEWVG